MNIHQLIKKNNKVDGYKNIYPNTFIEAIRDKLTNLGLDDILSAFNMLYLPYAGSKQDTRLLIPPFLRRKGLWITYVRFDNKIVTEWYNSDKIDDTNWKDDSNWVLSLELSSILDEYLNTDAFKNILYTAISNAITNLLTPDFIGPIIDGIIKDLNLPGITEDYINNYLNSQQFLDLIKQYIESSIGDFINQDQINELINNLVQEWLDNADLEQIVKDYIDSLDLTPIINEFFKTEEGQTIIKDAIGPSLEELLGDYFEAFRAYILDNERVIANALARHEQAITDLQNS